jgi:hypothetical protein
VQEDTQTVAWGRWGGGGEKDLPSARLLLPIYGTVRQLCLASFLLGKPAMGQECFAWRNEYNTRGLFKLQVAG